ncbi:PH domain-containing protein [Streptomyces qinzhouensis]|uniref:PH domain-containing protein n=1 Tax=Streptomyces qinzhouensis TaxID=2599401 RepID=A0A5B8JFM9_9ACTN|nr:PH domain-containing protein [Streptomyces qinzhouensis]QDY78681.1 PH domain-containing protein [Streptomyces qinzhouensis]
MSKSETPTPAEPTYADRVFRSPAGMAGGVLLLALTAWLGADAVIRGSGLTPLFAIAVVLVIVPVVVAFTLRPAVFVNDDRIRIRNPFRTIAAPWGQVEGVRSSYSTEIVTNDGTKYPMWAVPVSLRQRKRATRQLEKRDRDERAGRPVDRNTPAPQAQADRTVAELRDFITARGAAPTAQGETSVTWAYELFLPLAAGAVMLLVLFLVR